ncbi:zinc finger protein 813-like [Anopheles nili]|uniref:zinc finger protein 813-like n=1 Tax=Anopheles nili TaxID=185578 RepID=UPI00237B0CC0|nr:zinc finger protein 813-like [Anopheles nili]
MDYNSAYNKPFCGVSQPHPGSSGFFQQNSTPPTFLKIPNPPAYIKQESVAKSDTAIPGGTVTPPVNYSQNQHYAGQEPEKPFFYGKPFDFQYVPNAFIQPHPQQFTQHHHLHSHATHHHATHGQHHQQLQVQQQQQQLQQHSPAPDTVPSHVHSAQQQVQHMGPQHLQRAQHVTNFHDYPDHSNASSVASAIEPPAYIIQQSPVPLLTNVAMPSPSHSIAASAAPPAAQQGSRFSCETCPKSFDTKAKLSKHAKTHLVQACKQEFKCRMCEKVFRTKSTLICHEKVHGENGVDNNFPCAECGKVFASDEKLQVHRRLHTGEKPYQCKVCMKRFNHQSNLIVHSRIHEKVKKELKCTQCTKVLDNEERLAIHMRVHTGEKPYKCSYCDKRFNHKSTVSTHEKSSHIAANSFKCDRCHKTFNQKCQLQYHEKLQDEQTYTCPLCDKVFCYKAGHEEHMYKVHFPKTKKSHKKRHAGDVGGESNRIVSEGRNKFKCTVCDRRFYYKRALEVHMGVHDATLDVNVLYFSCNYCPETFTDEGPLQKHEAEHVENGTTDFLQNMKALEQTENPENGQGDDEFRCALCFKRFDDRETLHEHHKTHLCQNRDCTKCGPVHDEEFQFTNSTYDANEDTRETVCNVCYRVLPSFEQFQTHFHYHTSRVPFYCYHCRIEFNDKRELYAHTKTHSPRELESYTCEVCAKVFSTKGNFKRHLKSHESVRAFACDRCSKQYDYKSALEAHLKKSHDIKL